MAGVLAAAMISADVSLIMFMVVVLAVYITVINQISGEQGIYRIVGITCHPAI